MNGELLIRASWSDQTVIADLLAPGGGTVMVGRHRPVISRLVVDAPVAAQRPQFAEAASGAGIPLLVDPVTTLVHGELREEDPWVRNTPFGQTAAMAPGDFADPDLSRAFVRSVVDFQLEQGGTAVIAPYPYISSPDDPWLDIALSWLADTRAYMDASSIALPLLAISCGQLQKMGNDSLWSDGLDRFVAMTVNTGAQAIGLCLRRRATAMTPTTS